MDDVLTQERVGQRTAAELFRAYIDRLEARDVGGVIELLAPDAISEFPYAPLGLQSLFHGAEEVRPFLDLVIGRLLQSVKVNGVELTEVGPGRVFAEFTSDCVTKKGLAYQNRYVVRVDAADDRVTLWREYFDPRATETVK